MKDHSSEPAVIIPMLYIKDPAAAIAFYKKAFHAVERWRIENPDGSTHVAEMSVPPVIFRMHQEVSKSDELSPSSLKATSVVIGLLVNDPDELAARAIAAGAVEISPVQDYEYGYRQGTIRDPFGHHWCLEKIDSLKKIPVVKQ